MIEERIDAKVGGRCSGRWSRLASSSLLIWLRTDDLRLYGWVQFFPCVVLPLMFWLFAPKYSGTWYWFAAAGWYVLAKLLEHFDAAIDCGHGTHHGRPRDQACRGGRRLLRDPARVPDAAADQFVASHTIAAPGLTRRSDAPRKAMDVRVKPGHDERLRRCVG